MKKRELFWFPYKICFCYSVLLFVFFRSVVLLCLLLSVLYVLDIWYSFGRDDNESLNVSNHLLHLNSNICLDLLGVIVSIILSARLRCFLLACDWCLYVSCCQLGCHVSLFFPFPQIESVFWCFFPDMYLSKCASGDYIIWRKIWSRSWNGCFLILLAFLFMCISCLPCIKILYWQLLRFLRSFIMCLKKKCSFLACCS